MALREAARGREAPRASFPNGGRRRRDAGGRGHRLRPLAARIALGVGEERRGSAGERDGLREVDVRPRLVQQLGEDGGPDRRHELRLVAPHPVPGLGELLLQVTEVDRRGRCRLNRGLVGLFRRASDGVGIGSRRGGGGRLRHEAEPRRASGGSRDAPGFRRPLRHPPPPRPGSGRPGHGPRKWYGVRAMRSGKIGANTYVSPSKRARIRLSDDGQQKEPGFRTRVATRLVRMSPMVVLNLQAEEAPLHVFRWVSEAHGAAEQRRRTDLAVHLRRSMERRRNGWLEERHLTAALAVWDEAVMAARSKGLISPRPDAAVAAARKAPRGRADHPAGNELPMGSAEAAPTADERAPDKPDGVLPPARASTLRELTAVLDRALAQGDIESARVTHETIGRLVPPRRAE